MSEPPVGWSHTVRAAGGVVHRTAPSGTEVVLVHRDRYDDWTFPKGKLDPGESWEQAAVREVFEEARIVPVLGGELPHTEYRDHKGRPKLARYWLMTVAVDLGFEPNAEISDRRWVPLEQAEGLLSYDRDRAVLRSLRSLRHAR